MHHKEHHYVVDIEWLCALSAQSRMYLLEIAKPCRDALFRTPLPGIFYVVSGCLVHYMTTPAANNSLGLVLGRGSWFGIQSIHCAEHIYEIYEPMRPAKLLFFPKASIESLLRREPELYAFLFHIAQKMNRFGFQLTCNTLRSLMGRTVYALLHLAENSLDCHARGGRY
ncbi:Crp/Fnr family transcriptional regulator [Aeromonas enteropelogenes]|uniref:Crp/Fnr family transcriptional regulator n=1 Tax=Aeromonas enteropelogenes TaxID=29489 RepID=UPI003B9EF983